MVKKKTFWQGLPDVIQKAIIGALVAGVPSLLTWGYKEYQSSAREREEKLRHMVEIEAELKLKKQYDKDLLDLAVYRIQCGDCIRQSGTVLQ